MRYVTLAFGGKNHIMSSGWRTLCGRHVHTFATEHARARPAGPVCGVCRNNTLDADGNPINGPLSERNPTAKEEACSTEPKTPGATPR